MYSGTTLTRFSGRVLGAHQKIDRVARRRLDLLIPSTVEFPTIRNILHFEGKNGPDAIKRKSPSVDEPWHFLNPFDDEDTQLLDNIENHFKRLVTELRHKNTERASFEAAWLAHAIVDGLTPAHHFPYEEKLAELRGGLGRETRVTLKKKWIIPGETTSIRIRNNWKAWGTKGLFLTHGLFEIGVATIIKPLTFSDVVPTKEEKQQFQKIGIRESFRNAAREIAVLNMYENYYSKGWTPKLAYEVRHKLGPTIIKVVTLAWYSASVESQHSPLKSKAKSI